MFELYCDLTLEKKKIIPHLLGLSTVQSLDDLLLTNLRLYGRSGVRFRFIYLCSEELVSTTCQH